MMLGFLTGLSAQALNGGSATGTVDFFHGFQVALMTTIMFNVTQFVYWSNKNRLTGTCLEVHKSTLITLASAILVNVQPMWILVIGSYHFCCAKCSIFGLNNATTGQQWCVNSGGNSYTYPPWSDHAQRPCYTSGNVFWDESYCGGTKYALFPSKASGWMVQIFCTWFGFVLMFIGVMMATQLHVKLRNKWYAVRRGKSATRTAQTV